MSGHGPIYEWDGYSLATLRKALSLMSKLESLGFEQDEDLIASIKEEIRSRKN
jgi:hypothetical protein